MRNTLPTRLLSTFAMTSHDVIMSLTYGRGNKLIFATPGFSKHCNKSSASPTSANRNGSSKPGTAMPANHRLCYSRFSLS